jgi:F0F1-type ATP synthase membrane subunit c/vacuolar-type H+-ATPase subunit K
MAGLGLALACLAAALAQPSAAAADQACFGTMKKLPVRSERDTGVGYEFSCSEPAKAFFLLTTSELSFFDVSADVFDSAANGGAIRGDDRFGECEGTLPSAGFGCAGTYSAGGRLVRGSFDTAGSPCARNPKTRKVMLHAALIVEGATGKLSGPFDLLKPAGCPKAKTAKRHKRAKRH